MKEMRTVLTTLIENAMIELSMTFKEYRDAEKPSMQFYDDMATDITRLETHLDLLAYTLEISHIENNFYTKTLTFVNITDICETYEVVSIDKLDDYLDKCFD